MLSFGGSGAARAGGSGSSSGTGACGCGAGVGSDLRRGGAGKESCFPCRQPGGGGHPAGVSPPHPTSPQHGSEGRSVGIRRNPPRNFTTCLIPTQKNQKNKEGFGKGVRFGKLCLTCCCVLGPWTVCHLWRTLSCSQTPASPLCCSSPPNAGVKSHLCHAAVVPTPAFVRVRLGDAWEKKKEKRDKKTPNPRSQSIC